MTSISTGVLAKDDFAAEVAKTELWRAERREKAAATAQAMAMYSRFTFLLEGTESRDELLLLRRIVWDASVKENGGSVHPYIATEYNSLCSQYLPRVPDTKIPNDVKQGQPENEKNLAL